MAAEDSGLEERHLETVALEAGAVNWAYQCMCFGAYSPGLAEPQFVEVVPVCYIGDKLLVGVPFGSWHRSVSKRLLPSKFLSKAVTVEVGLCAPYQRESPEEGDVVKLWMGFISESLDLSQRRSKSVLPLPMESMPVSCLVQRECCRQLTSTLPSRLQRRVL